MKVSVSGRVRAGADQVFADVSDFGNLARLAVVKECTASGSRVGAIRVVTFTDAALGRVVERLESLDHRSRIFSYSIINDDCVLPVRNYLATVNVAAEGPDACVVTWGSTFDLHDIDEAEARRMFEGFYEAAIEAAQKALNE